MRKFVVCALLAAVGFVSLGAGSVAAADDKQVPAMPSRSDDVKSRRVPARPADKVLPVKPAQSANPGVAPAVVPNNQHPPIPLLVTTHELRLVLTNVGWVYTWVPVQYYVVAVWNPTYQCYGYFDRAGVYHLYRPVIVVPVPVPVPLPVRG